MHIPNQALPNPNRRFEPQETSLARVSTSRRTLRPGYLAFKEAMLTLKLADGRLGVDSWIRFHLMGTMLSLEGLVGYYRGPHGYQASEDSQYAEFDH